MRGKLHTFADLSGGLNTRDAPYALEPNESRDLIDVVPTARGAIRKRRGSSTFAALSAEFTSLHPLNLVGGGRFLVGAGGTKLFKVTTAGIVSDLKTGLTSGLRWEFAQAPASGGQGPLYGVNGTDTPQQWDGVAGGSADWTASAGAVPNGKYLVVAGNRVWIAGVPGDPSGLYWCELGDPRNWPAANVTRLDPNDGDVITGLAVFGPYVVAFKERKCFVVHDLDTSANRKLSDEIGTVGHRSVVETPAGLLFLGPDGAVYRTDASKVEEISDKVRPTLEAVAPARRREVAAALFGNRYELSYSAGGISNDRTLELDLDAGSWWLHSLAANEWAVFEPGSGEKLYAAKAAALQLVEAYVAGVNRDSGAAYLSRWASAFHTFGTPHLRKRCREVLFDGSGKVDLYVAKDFAAAAFQKTVDFRDTAAGVFGGPGGGSFGGPGGGSFGGAAAVKQASAATLGVARAFSIEFRQQEDAPFEIDSYAMAMTARKD